MRFIPRIYQDSIIRFIFSHERCNVWVGMGGGKTSATLAAINDMFTLGELSGKVLVLAPLRVAKTTWPDEVNQWDFPAIRIRAVVGDQHQRINALHDPNANVLTMNYENLEWLITQYKNRPFPISMIVADESTRLKGFRGRGGSKRAAALMKLIKGRQLRFVNLTGTPSTQGVVDLWGQQAYIDEGLRLGRSFTQFQGRWFWRQTVGFGIYKFEPYAHAEKEVSQLLSDCTISINPADYFDITQPIRTKIQIQLPPVARKQYEKLRDELFMELQEGLVTAENAAVKTMKLLQVASGAIYTGEEKEWEKIHDEKIKALESIVEEAAGNPIIVVYQFRHTLERLKRAFKQGRELDKNESTIREWNEGKIPLLFLHPQSAAHGISLQHGGHHMVFVENGWSLEHRLQAIERIGPVRQAQSGYKRAVFIYDVVATDTVDELVAERTDEKKRVLDALLEYMKK